MTKIGTILYLVRLILMENANTALDELKMIVSGMDTKASQLAVKRIKEILDENPQIVNEACRHIEVFFKDAPVQHKRSLLFLLDYLFSFRMINVLNYFCSSLPSILGSYYESAGDEFRKELGFIVGKWYQQGLVPYYIIDLINRKIYSICTSPEEQQSWHMNLMTKVIPRQAQPAPPMPQPSQQVLVYDGIDTTKSELNALFTVNSDLLERKVHATVQSHFEYVRDVFLYQLEQNKRNNVPQPEIRPIAANPDIGPMHFDFDWEKDRKTLQSEGRRYFFNLEKSYRFACDHCGMLIRNEVEYKSHLSNHLRNRELFERQKVSRGWLKRHVDWIDEGRRKDILEEKEREPSARVMYDLNYLRCGICGEQLETENVNDGVDNGLFFKDVVRPDPQGPIYHKGCYRIQQKQRGM